MGAKQLRELEGEEIAKHNSAESCWVVIHGKAYDVTEVSTCAQWWTLC